MDEPRTLPPLVNGKLSGVLDFFIDEIKIFENFVLLTNICDLVVQLQWWGEVLPVYIRPQELHLNKASYKQCQNIKCYPSAKYEIKTSLELFKSYLKTCEILELVVLEAVKSGIIGSAFLNNLMNIMNHNNVQFTMPIINYSGEEIGEIKIHTAFSEIFSSPSNQNVSNRNSKGDCFVEMLVNKTEKSESPKFHNLHFPNEKTISVNLPFKNFNLQNKSISLESIQNQYCVDKSSNDKSESRISATCFNTSSVIDKEKFVKKNDNFFNKKEIYYQKSLPEVELMIDNSKVLTFNKGLCQKKNKKIESIGKFHSGNKLVKNSSDQSKQPLKKFIKSNSNKTCCSKDKKHIPKLKDTICDNFPRPNINLNKTFFEEIKNTQVRNQNWNFTNRLMELQQNTSKNHSNLELMPCKGSKNKNVIDYLLGCYMSKDDEESALNELKKMSSTDDLVISIGQLCSERSLKNFESERNGQIMTPQKYISVSNSLKFNLNNDIEKKYFEKFFLESPSSQSSFEIAEFLNQPNNSVTTDKEKPNEMCFGDISPKNLKKQKFEGLTNFNETKDRLDVDIDTKSVDNISSCALCKYNKKLEELDLIIESLKNFEKKTLLEKKQTYQEPDFMQILQNSFESDLALKKS